MYKIPSLYLSKYFRGCLGMIPVRPSTASVKITENCNSRCTTCDMWKTKHKNEYSTEEFENMMKQMRYLGIESLRFTGGEPLLRHDIGILVKKARELGFRRVAIQTNGLLLSNKAEELVESGVTDIAVSVDGIGETNDIIRGVPHAYDKSIEGIKAVIQTANECDKKVNMEMSTTLTKKNIEQVPDLLNICKELGMRWSINILDQHLYFFQRIDISKLLIDDYQLVDKTIDYIKRIKGEQSGLVGQDNDSLEYVRDHIKGEVKEPPCVLAYINLYLGSKGEVYSGCWALKPIGNLRTNKLKDILQSDEYEKRARDMFMRKCPGCTCGYVANVQVGKFPSIILKRLKNRLKRSTAKLAICPCVASRPRARMTPD